LRRNSLPAVIVCTVIGLVFLLRNIVDNTHKR
jgi:hypothetical protein